jgi:hypothetical protein
LEVSLGEVSLGEVCLGEDCLGEDCLGKDCLGKDCLGMGAAAAGAAVSLIDKRLSSVRDAHPEMSSAKINATIVRIAEPPWRY